jgi:hypothetical protein
MSEDLRDKRSTPTNNATPYRSLRSVDKETLTPEAVADNIINAAEVERVEKSSNCNVGRLQNMGVP